MGGSDGALGGHWEGVVGGHRRNGGLRGKGAVGAIRLRGKGNVGVIRGYWDKGRGLWFGWLLTVHLNTFS